MPKSTGKLDTAKVVDVTIGAFCRGIGVGAFHAGRTPGVGNAARYCGGQIAVGYNNAEAALDMRKHVKAVVEIARKHQVTDAHKIRSMAESLSISPELLDDVRDAAMKKLRISDGDESPAEAPEAVGHAVPSPAATG